MTQHLLSVSGSARLEQRPVCCNQLVQAACDQARGLMGEHVALTTSLSTEPAGLEVDPHQMEQVLLNLILNARDATPGAGTIVVSTRTIAEDRVEIAVEDDGVGMSDEVQARAFEPFFTTKAAGRGTGLGLALVRGTVERHGGTVELCSRLGRGTRVAFQLPRRPPVERAPSAPRDEPSTPLCVVVLDDNDMVRGALCDLLRAGGHTVGEAALPSECLALIEERWPSVDLLVCDLVMPEMLGPSLVALLKESGLCPRRVVYVTGRGAPAEAMLAPGDIVLHKPVTAEQLAAAFAEVATRAPGAS
jgi:CheY-like chemotaxis protein